MNTLIISSSPRRGGNSDILCDEFMRGAKEVGHQVEKIFLGDKKINYCTGCGVCYNTKKCVQKDDMADIQAKMIAADVIVLASPVYFYAMSGQLKTMIDRCCTNYREMLNKDFYFILTAAEETIAALDKPIIELHGFLDCLDNPKYKGTVAGIGTYNKGDVISTPAMQEAYEMGKNI